MKDDKKSERHCILHSEQNDTHLSMKPIDCIFFICEKSKESRIQNLEMTRRWLTALDNAYPNSYERFKDLTEEYESTEQTSSENNIDEENNQI